MTFMSSADIFVSIRLIGRGASGHAESIGNAAWAKAPDGWLICQKMLRRRGNNRGILMQGITSRVVIQGYAGDSGERDDFAIAAKTIFTPLDYQRRRNI